MGVISLSGVGVDESRVINFHDLDYSNEGKRITAFAVYDMSESLPGPRVPAIEILREILADEANRQLSPLLLRESPC